MTQSNVDDLVVVYSRTTKNYYINKLGTGYFAGFSNKLPMFEGLGEAKPYETRLTAVTQIMLLQRKPLSVV